MKKYNKIFISLLLAFVLCACSKSFINVQQEKPTASAENIGTKADTNEKTLAATKESIFDIINAINENFNQSGDDDKYSDDQRKSKYNKFLSAFKKFLTVRDSVNWTDEKISELLGDEAECITKQIDYNNKKYSVRLITYNGATSVISRNPKAWTFIQWWNEDTISSELLFEGSEIRINDFCTISYSNKLVILMIGFSGKNPIAQSWTFNGDTFSMMNAFDDQKIVKRNGWEYIIGNNSIVIEKRKKDNNEEWLIPTIKINQNNIGFSLDSKTENIKEEFIFKDGVFCN